MQNPARLSHYNRFLTMDILEASQISKQLSASVGHDLSLYTMTAYATIATQGFGQWKQPQFPSHQLGEDPSQALVATGQLYQASRNAWNIPTQTRYRRQHSTA